MNAPADRVSVRFSWPPALDKWKWRATLFPLIVTVLAGLALASPELTSAWELERTAIADGQWWRLITGHLTHWNLDHLFWDAATFLALGLICMRRRPAATAACLLISSLSISATVLGVHEDLSVYRGLSGLDTALFTLLAVAIYQDARRDGDRALGAVAKWAVAALVAKTAYEVATGHTLFVDSQTAGFEPLASAHAVGAVVGLLAALAPRAISTMFGAFRPGEGERHRTLFAIDRYIVEESRRPHHG